MLRLSLVCLVAGVAVVSAVDLSRVVARLPFSQKLRDVDQAVVRVTPHLYSLFPPYQPKVFEPEFHYLLTLGVVDAAGKRIYATRNRNHPSPVEVQYEKALNLDLPKLYRSAQLTRANLKVDVVNVSRALAPLRNLKYQYCQDLDDKDCDKVLELKLQGELPSNVSLMRAVAVLKAASEVASSYLKLQEEIVSTGKSLSSVGYLANDKGKLATASKQHADVLVALNGLLE